MTDFIITITDPAQLDGITWAREQHNASLPPLPPPPDTVAGAMADESIGGTVSPPIVMQTADIPPTLETDEDYVQWVMENAAISYADQQLRDEHRKNYEAEAEAAGRKVI